MNRAFFLAMLGVALFVLGLVQAVLGFEGFRSGAISLFRFLSMIVAPVLVGIGLIISARQLQSTGGER